MQSKLKLTAAVKDGNEPFVKLKCSWEYEGNETNIQYQVQWYGDEFDESHKIQSKIFDATDGKEFVFESYRQPDLENINLDGYMLNKKVQYNTVYLLKVYMK